MSCEGLSSEIYNLHALGLLEGEDLVELREHLNRDCPTCRAALRGALQFWPVLGSTTATAEPRAELRRRVVAAAETRQPRSWKWAAAACFVAASLAGYGWFSNDNFHQEFRRFLRVVLKEQEQRIGQLKEENARLKGQVDEAAKRPPVIMERPAVERPPAPDTGLERALAEAKASASAANQTLVEERARAADLRTEIERQKGLLAESERKYRAAVEDAAKAGDRDKALAASSSKIRDLERQIVEYKNTLSNQAKKLQQSMQLASFLGSSSLRFLQLQGTEKGAAAAGHAFVAEGSKVLFYASQLPALPAGRVYQLWLIRASGPAIVSGGVFTADDRQRAVVEFRDPTLVRNVTALAVTDEPAGGSSKPTGHKFLIGQLHT